MVDETEEDEGRDGEEEAEGGGKAGALAVDVHADERGGEAGEDEGEEDQSCAEGVPAEELCDAKGEGGVPAGH